MQKTVRARENVRSTDTIGRRRWVLDIIGLFPTGIMINQRSSSCSCLFGKVFCLSLKRWSDGFPLILLSLWSGKSLLTMPRNVDRDLNTCYGIETDVIQFSLDCLGKQMSWFTARWICNKATWVQMTQVRTGRKQWTSTNLSSPRYGQRMI